MGDYEVERLEVDLADGFDQVENVLSFFGELFVVRQDVVLLVHLELLEQSLSDVRILFQTAGIPFLRLSLKVILSSVFLYSMVPPMVALKPLV